MDSPILATLIIYGLAAVISAFVAVMIKVIYWAVSSIQREKNK